MSVDERVGALLGPIVATLDLELLDVEFSGSALRLTVDRVGGGVTSEQLAEVNRTVSPILDQHDPIPGRYTLEVSSPGLERPLKRREHFERAVGEQVLVKLAPGMEPRRIRGVLVGLDTLDGGGSAIMIEAVEIDGVALAETEARSVAVETIVKARTLFEWGPGPKPGQPGAKKHKPRGPASSGPASDGPSTIPSQTRGAQ